MDGLNSPCNRGRTTTLFIVYGGGYWKSPLGMLTNEGDSSINLTYTGNKTDRIDDKQYKIKISCPLIGWPYSIEDSKEDWILCFR